MSRSHASSLALAVMLPCLTHCTGFPVATGADDDAALVYALGALEGFPSPLTSILQPACPALPFTPSSLDVEGRHRLQLQRVATQWASTPQKLIVTGYTPPDLPKDHARALSERRALAVRQHLIELGVEPTSVQTLGLGSDFAPTGPSSHTIVIYREENSRPQPMTPPSDDDALPTGKAGGTVAHHRL
ncbi:MAG: OmpA family protein [Verrucomicrobiales bacterium]|nr:OmpA family protein [Verrucomicrobiales bacterium]